ncbi:hypothetical protein [Selenomonas ruminantium]|uniref:hypothetical protein n=1 Tax=Selenomonas ruminantium TaxID=971 RepID=UPI0026F30A99|nr:hypothetical protein [Selenomonas ruminantium]
MEMHEHAKFGNVEYLLRRNDEFISIDGRKETNLERAKVKDDEIKVGTMKIFRRHSLL